MLISVSGGSDSVALLRVLIELNSQLRWDLAAVHFNHGFRRESEEEEVFVRGQSEPLRLSRDSFSLRLLEYVRDEAHRFAQHYHHLLRGKRTLEE